MDDCKWCLYKNVILQIDPLQCLLPETTAPRKIIKAINTPIKKLFGENSYFESLPCKSKCLQLIY